MGFHVDATLCRHCGLCAAGCVCGLIEYGEDALPCIRRERASLCVHCGHCIAVCPAGAISLDGQKADDLERAACPVPFSVARTMIATRRAVRNFQPEPVARELLDKLFALAAYAPTAHNAREVGYLVLNGREKVQRLLQATVRLMETHCMYPNHTRNVRNGHDTLFRGAPCLILLHAPQRVLSETDCATAAASLELAMPSLGLGSCWAGMLVEACTACGLPEGLELPTGHSLYAALMVGIPTVTYARIPSRSLPDIVWA